MARVRRAPICSGWIRTTSPGVRGQASHPPEPKAKGPIGRAAFQRQFIFATAPSAVTNVLHGTGWPCTGAIVATSSFMRSTWL